MNKLFAFMILTFSFTACQQQPTGEERKSTVEKELEQTGLQNVAVNVTLIDCTGHPIPMGSEYDYFGDRSRVDLEDQLIANGEINQRELLNRQLLREIMTEAGWLVEPSEWWHFNAMPLAEASQKLTVIK